MATFTEYIKSNPLFLHYDAFHFTKLDSTRIDLLYPNISQKAENKMKEYIGYLRNEEQEIIKALGGEIDGKNALRVLADSITDTSGKKGTIAQTAKFMQDLFGVTGMGTTYVRPNASFTEAPVSNIKLTFPYNYKTGKQKAPEDIIFKQNIFLTVPNAKLNLIVKERLKSGGHGREKNIYDYNESIAKASEKELEDFREACIAYVQSLNKAFEIHRDILSNLGDFVDLDALKTKGYKEGEEINVIKSLKNYMDQIRQFDGTITEQWLEFLVSVEGTYNALKGKFNEASASKLSEDILELFGDNFSALRGDKETGKNKKPDIIYAGGKIDAKLNPITVSMKQIDKLSEKYLKAHTTFLLGDNENDDSGAVNLIRAEDKIIGDALLYLSLNNAYFNSSKAYQIINDIYKYLIYVFLSGTSGDTRRDQAVFFVLTHGSKNNIQIRFLSMADILENIYDTAHGKEFNPNLKDTMTEEKNKRLRKIIYSIFYKRQKGINKAKDIGLHFSNSDELKDCIMDIASNTVLNNTFQIQVHTKYLSSRGIIV